MPESSTTNAAPMSLPLSYQSLYLGFAGSNKTPAAAANANNAPRIELSPAALPSTGIKSMEAIMAAQEMVPVLAVEAPTSSMPALQGVENWIDLMYETSFYERQRLPVAKPISDSTRCAVLLQQPPPVPRSSKGGLSIRNGNKRQLSPVGPPGRAQAGKPMGVGRLNRARLSAPMESASGRGALEGLPNW